MDLPEAVKDSRRAGLEALRDRLALLLADASPRDAAGLARQLAATLEQLDSLPTVKEATPLDALAARRAARKSRPAS